MIWRRKINDALSDRNRVQANVSSLMGRKCVQRFQYRYVELEMKFAATSIERPIADCMPIASIHPTYSTGEIGSPAPLNMGREGSGWGGMNSPRNLTETFVTSSRGVSSRSTNRTTVARG